jgi:hypothetical protein
VEPRGAISRLPREIIAITAPSGRCRPFTVPPAIDRDPGETT